MTDEQILAWVHRKWSSVYVVGRTAAGMRIGRHYVVVRGWPGIIGPLFILVRRAHRSWGPRRVADFLRKDLKL